MGYDSRWYKTRFGIYVNLNLVESLGIRKSEDGGDFTVIANFNTGFIPFSKSYLTEDECHKAIEEIMIEIKQCV